MTREKAIKIVKEFINGTCLHLVDQEALETLIPELAESEDERIKKDIINLIYWLKANPSLCSQYYKDRYDGILAWLEKQKEQKPAESISQLTVQGKSVYKICPRCKERMVRDDSKVYTSMPPQYGYECPKCGEMEFDTVMYDNPEMEEQKIWKVGENAYFEPNTDMWFIKKEQKPAEWSDTDNIGWDEAFACATRAEKSAKNEEELQNAVIAEKWLKEIKFKYCVHPVKQEWSEEQIKKIRSEEYTKGFNDAAFGGKLKEWSVEDEDRIRQIERIAQQAGCTQKLQEEIHNWLKSLRPSWKPSEEQMEALKDAVKLYKETHFERFHDRIVSLYEQLKKL